MNNYEHIVEGSLFNLYMCHNVVSMWDTSGVLVNVHMTRGNTRGENNDFVSGKKAFHSIAASIISSCPRRPIHCPS